MADRVTPYNGNDRLVRVNERLARLLEDPQAADAMEQAINNVVIQKANAAGRPRLYLNICTILSIIFVAFSYFVLYATNFAVTPAMSNDAINLLIETDKKKKIETEALKQIEMKNENIVEPKITIGSILKNMPGYSYFYPQGMPDIPSDSKPIGSFYTISDTPDYVGQTEMINKQMEPYLRMKEARYNIGTESKTIKEWHESLMSGPKYRNTKIGIIYQICYKIFCILFDSIYRGVKPSYTEMALLGSLAYSLSSMWYAVASVAGGTTIVTGILYVTRNVTLYPVMNALLSVLTFILLRDNNFNMEVGDNINENDQQPAVVPVSNASTQDEYAEYLKRILEALNLYKVPGQEAIEEEGEDADINALVNDFRSIILQDAPREDEQRFLSRITHFLNYIHRIPNRGGAKYRRNRRNVTKRRSKSRSSKSKKGKRTHKKGKRRRTNKSKK